MGRWGLATLALGFAGIVGAQPSLTGFVEYQGREEMREQGSDTRAHLATLRVDLDTPVGESWLAQLSTGVGLTFNQTKEGELSQTGNQVTGAARLRVLPRSIFPFEAFVERDDSRVSGELVGPDYTQTVYGFVQTYRPTVGTLYQLSYRHMDRADERPNLQPAQSESQEDFVSLAFSRALQNQQIDFSSDYKRIARENPSEDAERLVNVLRHRLSPAATLSVDSLVSSVESELDEQTSYNRTHQLQLSSNLFWRPQTPKPLLISASLLASGFDSSSGGQETENRLVLASASSTYQTTPALAWRTSGSASQSRSNDAEQTTSVLRTGLAYSPAEIPLARWAYRYSLLGDVGARSDSLGEDTQELAASASHGISRTRALYGGTGGMTISQQATSIRDTAEREEDSLTHSATADWTSSGAGARALFLRALASDTRRFDDQDTAFQLVNLQANGTLQASRLSSWTGSVTLQWSHDDSSGRSNPWLASGSANLIYRHERAFKVPLLRFSSEIRLLTEDLAQASADSIEIDRRETAAWINRFDYTIGRTQISLRGQVSKVDERHYGLVYLQVRRYFGRFAQ